MESPSRHRSVTALTLTDLPLRAEGRIRSLAARPERGGQELPQRLAELGFLPGERVRVLARALFGDPIAVRLGSGTFALRRFEADCIQIDPLDTPASNAP